MADINDYRGDENLGIGTGAGGGLLGFYRPDYTANAWDRFSQYNFSAKRDLWQQANIEKDKLSRQAGELLPFTYGDMMEPDRKLVEQSIQDYMKYFTENPNATALRFDTKGNVLNAKEHSDLIAKRDIINQQIKRANVRKTQDAALESQISKITDPTQRQKAVEWWQKERTKPLTEDMLLYPDFQLFDPNAYFKKNFGNIKVEELLRNPNDTETIQTTMTNFGRGLSLSNLDYVTNNGNVKKEFDDIMGNFNQIIEQSRGADGKVDLALLRKHPQGSSILDMMDACTG